MEAGTIEKEERRFCSEYSKAAGEEMPGTAKPVHLWLLVEYRGRWPREAVTVFSQDSRQRLSALRSTIPTIRVALIRQPERTSGPLSAFWAFSRERGSQLFQTEFTDYEDLTFDPDKLSRESSEKLFAVCTHGTHDLCCAQFGNKIYAEIRTHRENVWQISHIGGCRFAPNVVCLPHGLVYGRVERADCAAIVSSYNNGTFFGEKLRGRSCYSKPVQAAEYFLRQAGQISGIEDLRTIRVEQPDRDRWFIDFAGEGMVRRRVSICVKRDELETYKSCSARVVEPRERFSLVTID